MSSKQKKLRILKKLLYEKRGIVFIGVFDVCDVIYDGMSKDSPIIENMDTMNLDYIYSDLFDRDPNKPHNLALLDKSEIIKYIEALENNEKTTKNKTTKKTIV